MTQDNDIINSDSDSSGLAQKLLVAGCVIFALGTVLFLVLWMKTNSEAKTLEMGKLEVEGKLSELDTTLSELNLANDKLKADNVALQKKNMLQQTDVQRGKQQIEMLTRKAKLASDAINKANERILALTKNNAALTAGRKVAIGNLSRVIRDQKAMPETASVASRTVAPGKLKPIQDKLLAEFKTEIEAGTVEVIVDEGGLAVRFPSDELFRKGQMELSDEGADLLLRAGNILKTLEDMFIRIDGHTDNIPMGQSKHLYPTNWELAATRSSRVARFLNKKGKISSQKMAAVSFSEYQPVAGNDSAKNRRRNRRVELRLVPVL